MADCASTPVLPASQKLVALDRLRRLGLIGALKEYFQHALAKNIALILAAISYEPQTLAIKLELFRIAQEAISNAIRHGHAKVIRISLSIATGYTQLLIEDDGCGALLKLHDGLGIGSMRERSCADTYPSDKSDRLIKQRIHAVDPLRIGKLIVRGRRWLAMFLPKLHGYAPSADAQLSVQGSAEVAARNLSLGYWKNQGSLPALSAK